MDLGLYPILMIIATPIFIKSLGAEQYGLWMVLSLIIQMINVFNMGVGESTIRLISKFRVTHDNLKIELTINRNFSLSILLTLIAGLAGFIASQLIQAFNLFHIDAVLMDEAMVILQLFSFSAGLKFIEQVFLSVFKGFERFDISAKLNLVSRSSVVISSILLVISGYGLFEIIVSTLCLNVLNLIIQVVTLRKVIPSFDLIPRFRLKPWGDILSHNGWYWLQSIIGFLGFLSDRFLIAFLVDLETMGYYSIAAMVGNQTYHIFSTLGSFSFPRVSYLKEKKINVSEVYFILTKVILGLGWLMIVVMLLVSPTLFTAWLGAETFKSAQNFIELYLVYEAVFLVSIVPYQFINGTSNVKFNSFFELTLRSTYIILIVLFYHFSGTQGVIWGLIIGALLIIPIQLIYFSKNILKHNFWNVLFTLAPALLFIPLVLFTSIILKLLCAFILSVLYYKLIWSKHKKVDWDNLKIADTI